VQMVKLQDFKVILHITNMCICHCHHSTSRFSSSVNSDQVLFWVCHSTKQNCSSLLPCSFGDQKLQFRFQCHYNLIPPILLYLSKPECIGHCTTLICIATLYYISIIHRAEMFSYMLRHEQNYKL
jgi:hypothetical protein